MLFTYLIIINAIGMLIMKLDKHKAIRGKYRIPESRLWFIAIIGGAIGCTLGMNLFRHKTKHTVFRFGFPVLAILEFILIIFIIIKFNLY